MSPARFLANGPGSPDSRPIMRRFSAPVCSSSSAAYCPVRLMLRRTRRRSRTMSRPATRARPASGRISVDRIRTVVVLPALFGPSSENTLPRATRRSTPARTLAEP